MKWLAIALFLGCTAATRSMAGSLEEGIQLVGDLDSPDFAVRSKAAVKLGKHLAKRYRAASERLAEEGVPGAWPALKAEVARRADEDGINELRTFAEKVGGETAHRFAALESGSEEAIREAAFDAGLHAPSGFESILIRIAGRAASGSRGIKWPPTADHMGEDLGAPVPEVGLDGGIELIPTADDRMGRITILTLYGTGVDEDFLKVVSTLTQLRCLTLLETSVDLGQLEDALKTGHIKTLRLGHGHFDIPVGELVRIATIPSLEHLIVVSSDPSGATAAVKKVRPDLKLSAYPVSGAHNNLNDLAASPWNSGFDALPEVIRIERLNRLFELKRR